MSTDRRDEPYVPLTDPAPATRPHSVPLPENRRTYDLSDLATAPVAPWVGAERPRRGGMPPAPREVARAARAARAASTVAALTLQDLFMPPTAPRLALAPWLPREGLAMVHGPRGAGKTWLALAISLAVARGGSVLGWQAPRPLNVLHIDGETPLALLRRRLMALREGARAAGVPEHLVAPESMRVVAGDRLGTRVLDLMTATGQLAIAPHVRAAELVVIDSLPSLFGDVAEGGDWRPAEEWLLSLRRIGKAVLFVHHSGRAGRPRGPARQEDVLDAVIALRRPRHADATAGAHVEIAFDKTRELLGAAATAREALLVSRDGAAQWTIDDSQGSLARRAVALARTGRTQRAIAARLAVSPATVNRLLRRERAWPLAVSPRPAEGGVRNGETNGKGH